MHSLHTINYEGISKNPQLVCGSNKIQLKPCGQATSMYIAILNIVKRLNCLKNPVRPCQKSIRSKIINWVG
jgi:hypothetical protein